MAAKLTLNVPEYVTKTGISFAKTVKNSVQFFVFGGCVFVLEGICEECVHLNLMNYARLILICVGFFVLPVSAQITNENKEWKENQFEGMDGKKVVVTAPSASFVGGDSALLEYIGANFNYSKTCENIPNCTYLLMDLSISAEGKVTDVKVIETQCKCESVKQEAMRLMLASPLWKPAVVNEKNTASIKRFKLRW